MLKYLRNFITFPFLILEISKSLRLQKKFLTNVLQLEIDVFIKENDGSLNKKDIDRMLNFYALVVPALCQKIHLLFRETDLSHQEKLSLTYLAPLTGLFDDLFDIKNTSEQIAKHLIDRKSETGNNSLEKMMLHLWDKANENMLDTTLLNQSAAYVFKAQSESRKQKSASLTHEELKQITFQKGGISLVFYFSILNKPLSENERRIIHLFGAFIQLTDDLFDSYEDHKEGIKTLVTSESNIGNVDKLYQSLIHEFTKEVDKAVPELKKQREILNYFYFIASRGLVCLDMLQKRQKERNGIFAVGAYSRKELICDMEKPLNFLKSWHSFAKLRSRLP